MGAVNTQSQVYASMAAAMSAIGLELVPIPPGYKYPKGFNDWRKRDFSYLADNWPDTCGIGIRTGSILGMDIDVYHDDGVTLLLDYLKTSYPNIVGRIGQAPKILIPFLCDDIESKLTSTKWADEHGVINQIEILAKGQQFVAYGIHPDTKKPYTWTGDFLQYALPEISLDEIHELFTMFDEMAAEKGWTNLDKKDKAAKVEFTARLLTNRGTAPGDRYNRCCGITDVLREYGWKHYRGKYWTRPDKKTGVSATVFNDEVVYIWTTSTSLTANRIYDNFGLLTHYEYNGDFSAAARALREVA